MKGLTSALDSISGKSRFTRTFKATGSVMARGVFTTPAVICCTLVYIWTSFIQTFIYSFILSILSSSSSYTLPSVSSTKQQQQIETTGPDSEATLKLL